MFQSVTLQAGLWGWLAASSLLIGAALGLFCRLPKQALASVMAYGSGVLIAALCFEQIPESERLGGLGPTLAGLLSDGVMLVLASQLLLLITG